MAWIFQLTEHWKHKEGIANSFGVILYTDEHPHIKKVLADDDYWAALDKMSGPRWAVFSIRAKAGYYGLPNLRPGTLGMMIPVWKEPRENEALLREFEIKSTKELPLLFVFAQGTYGEILRHSISLDDSSIEKAYDSLKIGIKVIAEAIQDVLPENLKSAEGVHAAINLSVSNYKYWQSIKKGISFYKWIKELLP